MEMNSKNNSLDPGHQWDLEQQQQQRKYIERHQSSLSSSCSSSELSPSGPFGLFFWLRCILLVCSMILICIGSIPLLDAMIKSNTNDQHHQCRAYSRQPAPTYAVEPISSSDNSMLARMYATVFKKQPGEQEFHEEQIFQLKQSLTIPDHGHDNEIHLRLMSDCASLLLRYHVTPTHKWLKMASLTFNRRDNHGYDTPSVCYLGDSHLTQDSNSSAHNHTNIFTQIQHGFHYKCDHPHSYTCSLADDTLVIVHQFEIETARSQSSRDERFETAPIMCSSMHQ